MTRPWRLGASAAAHNGALCTIWEFDPAEEPDGQGRRPSDRLVGALGREDAELVVAAVNRDCGHQAYIETLSSLIQRLRVMAIDAPDGSLEQEWALRLLDEAAS